MTGVRPAPQVVRWTTPRSTPSWPAAAPSPPAGGPRAGAAHAAATARSAGAGLRAVDGVVEAAVVVQHGTRVRAVALRLVGQDGKWRVSALQVG